MSSSDKAEAMPIMMAFARLPNLYSVNCLTRYSGCWPCRIGFAGLPREPSLVWQAAQTLVEMAWPFARSGLASAATGSLAMAAGAANIRQAPMAEITEATDFMEGSFYLCKTA